MQKLLFLLPMLFYTMIISTAEQKSLPRHPSKAELQQQQAQLRKRNFFVVSAVGAIAFLMKINAYNNRQANALAPWAQEEYAARADILRSQEAHVHHYIMHWTPNTR